MIRCTWLAVVFVFTNMTAHALEPSTEGAATRPATAKPTTDTTTEAGSPAVEKIEAEISSTRAGARNGPIHSVLINKEFPLTGIKWGGQALVDFPLNDEPEAADITLRSARLAFWKAFSPRWSFKLTALYNSGSFNLSDNYLLYSGWKTAIAQVGVFDPPFSMESLSSSVGLTFMERSLAVYALSENKNGGFAVLKRTSNNIFSGGVFFLSPEQDKKRQSGQALVMRYAYSPLNFLGSAGGHVGGSFSYRINADASETEFKSRPEVGTTDENFVDTGHIPGLEKVFRFGLEAVNVNGRFSWQAEVLSARVERRGYEDVVFNGAYAYASWFLTEDRRNYDAGRGLFSPLLPRNPLFRGGKGAFELAARASFVDLTDEDIIGGEESNISLGINWYLNSQLRVMSNVVKVLSVDRPGSVYDGETPLIFALRLQWIVE
jgi:phosphate-selective porin OprO/OprP